MAFSLSSIVVGEGEILSRLGEMILVTRFVDGCDNDK